MNLNFNLPPGALARDIDPPNPDSEEQRHFERQDARERERRDDQDCIRYAMEAERLGRCDKKQYEHAGPHKQIHERGQTLPPFPCENFRPE